jgi:methionyl-tRNA synthetase
VTRETYYVTTLPLPPTRELDLAAARELILADALARHERALGRDVRLVPTSLDRGRSIEHTANERGGTVEDVAEDWAERCEATLEALHVQHSGLVRSTQPEHQHVAKALFLKLFDQGDIRKGTCARAYCTECKQHLPDDAAASKETPVPCPECGAETIEAEEECFFLRCSKYKKKVLANLEQHAEFIVPASRRDALIEAVEKDGLSDVRISRAASDSSIPVPISPQHAISPMFDTLITYLTASGYLAEPQMFERYWPPDLQVIAPEDVGDHALAWPAVLTAVGLPLPQRLLVRGRLQVEDDLPAKLAPTFAGPGALVRRAGSDAVRLAVLSGPPCTEDMVLSHQALVTQANEHLESQLGRLVDLTAGVVGRVRDGAVPRPGALREPEEAIVETASNLFSATSTALSQLDFQGALDEVWAVVEEGLAFADRAGVTTLAENGSGEPRRLSTSLYVLAEVSRLVAHSLRPLLPAASDRIDARFGVDYEGREMTERGQWGLLHSGSLVQPEKPLFATLVLPTAQGP